MFQQLFMSISGRHGRDNNSFTTRKLKNRDRIPSLNENRDGNRDGNFPSLFRRSLKIRDPKCSVSRNRDGILSSVSIFRDRNVSSVSKNRD